MKSSKVTIIAEAGVNHNGSIEMAIELVDRAVDCGADIVKFQTFKASELVSRSAKKAEYQARTTGGDESQLQMIQRLELSQEAHHTLLRRCREKKIEFLSTPFDFGSIDFLVREIGLKKLKIGSGEVTNAPFLLRAAQTNLPLILSTGMSSLQEVETALSVIAFGYTGDTARPSVENFRAAFKSPVGKKLLQEKLTILHCTTEYPAPFDEVNLRAMDTLREHFGLPVGFSDHTEGIAVPIAAVARGASVIEKHFTLDKTLPGPDHRASLDPVELKAMILAIRQVEGALGTGVKEPAASELKNKEIARKSLVARQAIRRGERFTEQNLGIKRPGSGLAPIQYWDVLGTVSDRDYQEDDLIQS